MIRVSLDKDANDTNKAAAQFGGPVAESLV
jgi:hypothetical protein